MARVMPTSAISPKMFQHFAIITVVITGLLALFADGESREAIEATVARNQAHAAASQAERSSGKAGKPVFKRADGQVEGRFGGEEGMPATPRKQFKRRKPPGARIAGPFDRPLPPGVSAEEYAERTRLQRESYEKNRPSEETVERILEQSRRRSNRGGGDFGDI